MGKVELAPCLIVVSGPPLHGKTTVEKSIRESTNVWGVGPDELRHFAFPRLEGLRKPEDENRIMEFAYEVAVRAAEINLACSTPVPTILAAPFSREGFKKPLREFWERNQVSAAPVPIHIFRMWFSETVSVEEQDLIIRNRIQGRKDAGDPAVIDTIEKYRWALTLQTPWWEGSGVIDVDASASPEAIQQMILGYIT